MDLTRAVAFRGAALNNPVPAVGKPGASGCMVEVADISDISHAEFSERLREQDGLNVIEPYGALQTVTLQGSLFAPTRGQLFDALQHLREVFSPTKALLESPSTKGFLPLTYSEPHDAVALRVKTLQCRPLGLRWQMDNAKHGTTGLRTDASALALQWTVQLLVKPEPVPPPPDTPPDEPPIWPPPPEELHPIFHCTPVSRQVPWGVGGGEGFFVMTSPYGDHPYSGDCTLYGGCTYRVDYTVYHSPGSNDISAHMTPSTGPATSLGLHWFGSRCTDGVGGPSSHVRLASETFTVPETRPHHLDAFAQFYFYCNSTGTSVCAKVFWVSGPDPRFGPGLCGEGVPDVGNLVNIDLTAPTVPLDPDGKRYCEFTQPVIYPYVPGTLHITIDGTPIAVVEGDPYSGQYSFDLNLVVGGAHFVLDYQRVAPPP